MWGSGVTHTNYLFTAGTMVHAFPPRTQNIAKQPEVIGLCQSFPKQDHHLTYLSLNNIKSANSIHDQTRISSKFLEERKCWEQCGYPVFASSMFPCRAPHWIFTWASLMLPTPFRGLWPQLPNHAVSWGTVTQSFPGRLEQGLYFSSALDLCKFYALSFSTQDSYRSAGADFHHFQWGRVLNLELQNPTANLLAKSLANLFLIQGEFSLHSLRVLFGQWRRKHFRVWSCAQKCKPSSHLPLLLVWDVWVLG